MSHWHYQLMRHLTPDGETYYAVHEYYPLDTGPAWTEKPVTVDGESKDAVVWMLDNMLKDIWKHGVKDYDADLCILKDMDTHGVKDYDADQSNT